MAGKSYSSIILVSSSLAFFASSRLLRASLRREQQLPPVKCNGHRDQSAESNVGHDKSRGTAAAAAAVVRRAAGDLWQHVASAFAALMRFYCGSILTAFFFDYHHQDGGALVAVFASQTPERVRAREASPSQHNCTLSPSPPLTSQSTVHF